MSPPPLSCLRMQRLGAFSEYIDDVLNALHCQPFLSGTVTLFAPTDKIPIISHMSASTFCGSLRRSKLLAAVISVMVVAPALVVGGHTKVLLTSISALTFTQGKYTTGRRSSPLPQLTCSSGPCSTAVPSVQCANAGNDGAGNVQWKCETELPKGIRLGLIDVSCEGYNNPEDPYVLAGSCGLTYGLIDERRPASSSATFTTVEYTDSSSGWDLWSWLLLALILYAVWFALCRSPAGNRAPSGDYGQQGNGYYAGGGAPSGGPGTFTSGYNGTYTQSYAPPPPQAGWRPGFWTGLLGGTWLGRQMGGGYYQNNYYQSQYGMPAPRRSTWTFGGGGSPSGSSNSSTHTSTGYGGTTRR